MIKEYLELSQSKYKEIGAMPAKKFGYAVILLLSYYSLFARLNYISNIFRYIMLFIVGLFVLFHLKIILKKKYLSLNFLTILFVLWCLFSSYINRNSISSRDPFLASIVYFGAVLETLLVIEILVEKYDPTFVVKLFYYYTLTTVIVADFLIFAVPSLVHQYGGVYLVGTKFSVSYLHAQLIALLITKQSISDRKDNFHCVKLILLIVYSVFISIYVDCMTGVIVTVLFFAIYYLFTKARKILMNPFVVVVFLLLCCSILMFSDAMLENNFVQDFIVNVLNRSLTLTGRTEIYERLPEIMQGHWLLGYGYGSDYEISMRLIGFANTQNGLFNWCIQCGLTSAVLIVIMLFFSFKNAKESKTTVYPIVVMIYCFCFIASVEICIEGMFFTLMFLVSVITNYEKNKLTSK